MFDGYKLAEDSPAIYAGKVITDANGFLVGQNFFGNTITTIPDIGAAEYVGTLISTMYMTDEDSTEKVSYVPLTAKNPTMASEFLSNITVSKTSKVTVLRDRSELSEKDLLSGGEILRITAGNNAVTEHTVKQLSIRSNRRMNITGEMTMRPQTGKCMVWSNVARIRSMVKHHDI